MICWKHEKPEGISGQVGRSKPPGVPFTHNEQRQKAETAPQLGAMIERKFKPWGLGGGGPLEG